MMTGVLQDSLCSTCKYQETCQLKASLNRQTLFCEEFTCGTAENYFDGKSDSAFGGDDFFTTHKLPLTMNRLCDSCMNTASCALAPDRGSVWHCEEYR